MNALLSPCVACSSAEMSYFGSRSGYTYYRCVHCGTLQLVPMPDAASMEEAYRRNYTGAGHCQADPDQRNKEARPQFDAVCEALFRHTAPGFVLDYGAGWGGLAERLRDCGIDVEAAELSSVMADHCESRSFAVKRCGLEHIPGTALYDAIVLSSVFEHLLEHERWTQDAHRLLRPGGLVVSLQPTSHFATFGGLLARFGVKSRELPQLHQVFWPPWHTALFSLQGMRLLFERTGFDLLEVRPAPFQRQTGLVGLSQRVLSVVNTLATPVFGIAWPLHVGHVFVFRKCGDCVP